MFTDANCPSQCNADIYAYEHTQCYTNGYGHRYGEHYTYGYSYFNGNSQCNSYSYSLPLPPLPRPLLGQHLPQGRT